MYESKINYYLRNSDIKLNREDVQKLSIYLSLLLEYNQSHDLTRITEIDDIIIKHFIDSLYITCLIQLPTPLLDIGTGAGFPGIPLAIALKNNYFILAESKHKRVEFLNIVKKHLNFTNVDIYPHLVTEKSFFSVAGVITRAVESINETLLRCTHFLREGNLVIFLKGPSVDEELANTVEGFSIIHDIPYTLPNTTYDRRLLVFKKTHDKIRKIYYIAKDGTTSDGIAITSSDNKRFKEFKKVVSNPKKYRSTFVVGKKLIQEILSLKPQSCKHIILYDEYSETDISFIQLLAKMDKSNVIILKKSLFNELDITKSQQPMMLTEVPEILPWEYSCQQLSLMLPFQDPVNIGAAIRSAVAFGVNHIIVSNNAAYPYHPKSVRASAGAVFFCTIENGPPLSQLDTSKLSYPIIALDLEGENIHTFTFPPKAILLAGPEGQGLPNIENVIKVKIPITTVESLNATVAISIALYEWHKQRVE